MKKLLLSLFLIITSLLSFGQETITVTGQILDSTGEPLPGAQVLIKGTSDGVQTDFDGNYTIENVPIDAVLSVRYLGFSDKEIQVGGRRVINVVMASEKETELGPVYISISPNNYWTGAKLGYNLIGDAEGTLVGSGSLRIFDIEKWDSSSLTVVGSIGSFSFKEKDIPKFDEQVKKLAQSVNGLSLGIGYVNEFHEGIYSESKTDQKSVNRIFVGSGIRYNNYQDVGENDITVDFLQWATGAGYELELENFINGGSFTFSASINAYVFGSSKYEAVFNEARSSIVSYEATVILPISKKTGILANGTYTSTASPVYTVGLIFK